MYDISKIVRKEIASALAHQCVPAALEPAVARLEMHAVAISQSLTGVREEVAAFMTRQAHHAPGNLTLDCLEAGLPSRFRRNLASDFRLLSKGDKQPPCQELCQWWWQVEAGMLGMGRNINPIMFINSRIQRVAPTILGEPTWAVLVGERFEDWSEFRAAIERHYGLTWKACLRAFFNMRPEEEESTAEFIQ